MCRSWAGPFDLKTASRSGKILVMAALGSGDHLWRVDVVLRRSTQSDSETSAVVDMLTAWLDDPTVATDEEITGAPRATYSFDLNPPEGSIGVSCWVRADNVGQATRVGHDAVVAAAQEVTGQLLPLWDLRVVPRSAMMTRDEYGLT
jgi:hypothetical protein